MEARMLRMDEINKIRKDFFSNQKSIDKIAQDYNRSWDTIRKIVLTPEHKLGAKSKRNKDNSVITPEVQAKINELIEYEVIRKVPKKQRFTSKVVYKIVKEECDYKGSAKRIRTVVAIARREFKLTVAETFLNLDFEFGKYLQIDHGEVQVVLNNNQILGYLFVATIPGACVRFCQFYQTKASEAWGRFHEDAFHYFGGVFENAIYDNDSVLKINATDEETTFAVELKAHYGFKTIYCNKASGWEKGAVENAVGYCRRNFLPGVAEFISSNELNIYLKNKCDETLKESHYSSGKLIKEYYEEAKKIVKKFNNGKLWGRYDDLPVSDFQQITYRNHLYSLPERYVGATLKVFITVDQVFIYDENELITTHSRCFIQGENSLLLDHYLDQLERKPNAIPHARVIKAERFSSVLIRFWEKLKEKHKEKDGNTQFVMTLKLRRQSSLADFEMAIELAMSYHAISFDGVKSILSQLQIEQVRSVEDLPKLISDDDFNINQYSELQEVLID
jgi:transposase